MSSPRPPLAGWRIQHQDPYYGYAWYCGRGIIVSQVTTPHGSAQAARNYHGFEERILRERAQDCERAGGLFVIHDWRLMETYDADARRVWQERMRERAKGYLRGSVVCVANAGALLRMAVQAVNVVASVTHGAKVELSDDLDAMLRKYGLQDWTSLVGTPRNG